MNQLKVIAFLGLSLLLTPSCQKDGATLDFEESVITTENYKDGKGRPTKT